MHTVMVVMRRVIGISPVASVNEGAVFVVNELGLAHPILDFLW